MKYLTLLTITWIWLLLPPTYGYEINTKIVRQKLADPAIHFKQELAGGSNKLYHIPQVRPITLRDSGRSESLMFIKNTNYHYIGNVGFYVPQLSLSIVPNNPASPAVFDDPTSFSLHLHKGSIVLSSTAMEALFNKQIFNSPKAVIKDVKVATAPGVMTFSGQMYRGKWIPFVMKGNVTIDKKHLIYYKPTSVIVNGVDTTKVLTAANVKLDELLTIHTPGAELVGSTMILDTLTAFPPPKLYLTLTGAKIEDKGLVLEFDDEQPLVFAKPFASSTSHILVKGGDLKIMRTMPLNVSLQIDDPDPNQDLDFCLYRYRDQVTQGRMTLTRLGEIHAFFPKVDCAY